MTLFNQLNATISRLDVSTIATDRKKKLQPLIEFIQVKVDHDQEIRLNFICTHNSRRSHLSQVWAQTMAYYFKISNVFCYSGGTEATAVFPQVILALTDVGFQIEQISLDKNPSTVLNMQKINILSSLSLKSLMQILIHHPLLPRY